MKRVLITGASGFVGFHLVEKCLAAGLQVYIAVRRTSIIGHLQELPIHYTYPDFNSITALKQELEEKQYDFIIHAAGITKAKNNQEYAAVNTVFAANLAQAAAEAQINIQKFVFMSSLGAIGPLLQYDQLITSETQPRPVTAYGKSKLQAEALLEAYGLPLTVLRPTAVYGPREKDIFIILKTIASGYEPYIGTVQQQLSFIYVEDLADLTVNALFSQNCGAYNVTDGNCYDRYQMAEITKKHLAKKTVRFHIPHNMVAGIAVLMQKGYSLFNKTSVLNKEKLNELTAVNWCCDISKVKNELNFRPQYDLEKGLQKTLDWYKTNQWL